MLRYRSGETVKPGFYFNLEEWEAQVVPKEGGVLGGEPTNPYIRLPLLAVLVLAPVMGAVYAFFLPFIGIAMVTMYLAGRLRRLFTTTPPAKSTEVRPFRPAARTKGKEEEVEVRRKAA